MKKILLLFVLFIGCLTNAQSWQNLGTTGVVSSKPANALSNLTIDVDNNNIPYCSYTNPDATGEVNVKKLIGNAWVNVGPTINSYSFCWESTIAIDNNNVPYVAYLATFPTNETIGNIGIVKKFDGTNWVTVGATGFTTAPVSNIKIKISTNNIPYISYNANNSNGEKVIVKRFNGTNWVSLGTIDNDAWAFYDFQLDNSNTPFVIYNKVVNLDVYLYAKKFNGTSWVDVGTAGLISNNGYKPNFAFDTANNPNVAFLSSPAPDLIVKKFNGTSWVNVGNIVASVNIDKQKIVIGSNNIPYVAYKDIQNNDIINLKKWNGTTWVLITTPTPSESIDENLDLAIGSNNVPYIAYSTPYEFISDSPGKIKAKFYGTSLSTNQNELLADLKVYPNPTVDFLNIDTSGKISKITITDLLGKTVLESSQNLNKIDVINLRTGNYLLKISNTTGDKTIKILKN